MGFRDRAEAGRRLGEALTGWRGRDPVVLGLARGGVPVAAEVAVALGAPLDVLLVRKLGVPFQPELALGALGETGARVLNREVLRLSGMVPEELEALTRREQAELERRARRLRGDRSPSSLAGRVAVVVDDGVATGATARVACQLARQLGAAEVVLAVALAPRSLLPLLAGAADCLVCLETPEPFLAVGEGYDDFTQVSEEEVARLLQAGRVPPRGD